MLPLTLLLAQNPLAHVVTFEEPAMPLGRLLPALGAKSGIEIVAAGAVAKDVALVRVKEKPLGEILMRLAQADGVEIEPTKTGFRLVRTVASERKELSAALMGRMASLRPALIATQASLDLPADTIAYRNLLPRFLSREANVNRRDLPSSRAGEETPDARLPIVRAAMRATMALPVELVADLREGDRYVFSNLPTKLQRPLGTLGAILRTFENEQTAWTRVTAGKLPEPNSLEGLDTHPARAVLIVRRTNSSDSVSVQIVVLNADGKNLASASYGMQSKESRRAMANLQAPGETTPVPLSDETRTLIEGVPGIRGSGPEKATPDAERLLSHPEERDPLSFAATDLALDMVAGRNVVAILPDPVWLIGFVTPGGLKRTDRGFFETHVDSAVSGDWVTMSPRDPRTARRERVDRQALGLFVRTVVATRRVPLDAYAQYAWSAADSPSDLVGVFDAMMIAPGTLNPDVEWPVLRLYGSLSVSDRKSLLSGNAKSWASLSPAQRTLAEKIVARNIRSMSAPADSITSRSLIFEPTEVYSEGFDTLRLSLRSQEDSPLYCASTTDPKARQWRRVLEPSSAGYALAQLDGPHFDRFGVVRRTVVSLSISVKAGFSTGAILEDVIPPERPLVPLAELPPEIRALVEEGIRRGEAERQRTP